MTNQKHAITCLCDCSGVNHHWAVLLGLARNDPFDLEPWTMCPSLKTVYSLKLRVSSSSGFSGFFCLEVIHFGPVTHLSIIPFQTCLGWENEWHAVPRYLFLSVRYTRWVTCVRRVKKKWWTTRYTLVNLKQDQQVWTVTLHYFFGLANIRCELLLYYCFSTQGELVYSWSVFSWLPEWYLLKKLTYGQTP